jgi:hypothetical protein
LKSSSQNIQTARDKKQGKPRELKKERKEEEKQKKKRLNSVHASSGGELLVLISQPRNLQECIDAVPF